jgi:hypothetical protein
MLVERKEFADKDTGTIGYIESVFNSGNVLKTTYFPQNQRLYIAFSRGDTYSFANISPDLYQEFEDCESQGKFFHQKLNNKPAYPSRKEFTLYPNEVKDLKEIIENNKQIIEDE